MAAVELKRLRVLHIFTPAPAGGLESVLEMLLPGLAERGVAVAASAVIGLEQPEPPCLTVLRNAGVALSVHRLSGRAYRREIALHRALLHDFGAGVVHTHGYRADVLGSRAAGAAARVATVHGFTGGDWKNRLYEWLQVRTYRGFDAVIAVSQLLRDQLGQRGIPADRLHLIPNAFRPSKLLERSEARRVLGLQDQGRVIGWVGRFSQEKAPDLFLQMAAGLRDQDVRFVLVGDGPMRQTLEAQARELNIAERVTWTGLVPGAARCYRAFDGLVLSSRTEGTPIALFEAMAAEVPVVATRVGGVPQVLDDSTGWLVAPENPGELVAAARALLEEPHEAKARTLRAQNRLAQAYALEPWLDRHCELYARVLR